MSRIVLFICALMQAQVIVSVALSPTTICPERCDDDGPDGRCPPACLSCAPSAHAPTPLPVPLVTVPSVQRERLAVVATIHPPEPDPADILHVPKHLLA
jgi:hypothetical protein